MNHILIKMMLMMNTQPQQPVQLAHYHVYCINKLQASVYVKDLII